ncbi:MAG: SDR family oxidoreductase [Armatimonadetes bacterium]|nr:SDR family oxidoreductase [Armatimonadota bacterium]
MSGKLEGRIAVVTGGGRGIGAQICRTFAQQGAGVAVVDIQQEAAGQVAEAIGRSAGQAIAVACDVTDRDDVEQAADQVEQELGPLAIWVNNAGVSYILPFLECTEQIWDQTLEVNLKGAYLGCQAAVRRMAPRQRGVIINMSSQSGKVGNSHYAAYCASKFGVIGLTQSLAVEFAAQGIRVNAICPGVVPTPMWDTQIEDYARKRDLEPGQVMSYFESEIPMGRVGNAEEIAQAALFLASDEAAYITGQALNVSGGAVMH